MSTLADAFDRWIRGTFVELNTELENLYFAQSDHANVEGVGDQIKARLRDEGHGYVVGLWREGNTGEGFDSGFSVLGNVGLYMGALRRHELTNPDRDQRSPFAEASSLAMHVGASIGMAPRFATAHLATNNLAVAGVRKSFTSLADEFLFIDENTRGILGFQRAADALARIVPLGVSSPVADVLFEAAKDGLRDVIRANDRLFQKLDVDRFFYSVRPYYKPYHVGRTVYRGANAGDFSGINEIDLLLGLCRASDTYYAGLLVDKMLFMLPSDQARLRECMTHRSLLDELLLLADEHSGDRLVPAECAAVPRGLRSLRKDRRATPRSARLALHRRAGGRSQCCAPAGDNRQRSTPPRAHPLAGSSSRLPHGRAECRPRYPPCRSSQAPRSH